MHIEVDASASLTSYGDSSKTGICSEFTRVAPKQNEKQKSESLRGKLFQDLKSALEQPMDEPVKNLKLVFMKSKIQSGSTFVRFHAATFPWTEQGLNPQTHGIVFDVTDASSDNNFLAHEIGHLFG